MPVSNFVPTSLMRRTVRQSVRRILSPSVPVTRQRRLLDVLGRLAVYPPGITVERTTLGGRPCERIAGPAVDPDNDPGRALLYLHGGAYIVCGASTHRALAARLAVTADATVYLLDYRMAPEAPYPAAVEDAVAAYLELRRTAGTVTVAGDSAGGGLALALMTRLRAAGEPLPQAAGLMSPWVDLTLANVEDSGRDPMLSLPWLRAGAEAYAAGTDLAAPELSPLFADLSGLPPVVVQAGTDEILLGDVERLVDALRSADVSVDYHRLEGLWHVAQLQAGLVADATEAADVVARFLSAAMDRRPPSVSPIDGSGG